MKTTSYLSWLFSTAVFSWWTWSPPVGVPARHRRQPTLRWAQRLLKHRWGETSVFHLVHFFFFNHSSVSAADTRANKVAKDFYSYDLGFTFSDPTLKFTKHLDSEQLGSWYDAKVEEERCKIRSLVIFIFLTKVCSCLYRFFVKIHCLIIHRYTHKSVFPPISSKTKILPCSLNLSCHLLHCFSSDSLRHF